MTSPMPMALPEGLTTPTLVVDVDVMERAQHRADGGGVTVRRLRASPARQDAQVGGHRCPAIGLSVATISEAEAFSRAGAEDVFIAYPV